MIFINKYNTTFAFIKRDVIDIISKLININLIKTICLSHFSMLLIVTEIPLPQDRLQSQPLRCLPA